ncbi:sensor histidine kinase [Nonomuraea mangrovi]|uniref:Sensor histidine kinase n=1 Tax=Nonomuraea mangrovi TaxID=2316207 RepID=A0ABW4TD33_9ACTN
MAERAKVMPGNEVLSRESLAQYLTQWSRDAGVNVEIWALPDEIVPAHVMAAVSVCITEALSNIEKCGQVRTVSVVITVSTSGLRLTISDDGQRFETLRPGFGIAVMRAAIGGSFSINGTPGGDITISGAVPRTRW